MLDEAWYKGNMLKLIAAPAVEQNGNAKISPIFILHVDTESPIP
jgi:hypothetical protein